MSNKKHFIAMAGICGCLPNFCESYETKKGAVETLASIHELSKRATRELSRDCYLSLDIHKRRTYFINHKRRTYFINGNGYAEIQECDCDSPEDHNDI